MSRAEILVKYSLLALGKFLGEEFAVHEFQETYEKALFENWDEIWRISQKYLLEIPFTDKKTTLFYIVEHYLPFYNESLRPHIELLLSRHADFWDLFYRNMVEAKDQITET